MKGKRLISEKKNNWKNTGLSLIFRFCYISRRPVVVKTIDPSRQGGSIKREGEVIQSKSNFCSLAVHCQILRTRLSHFTLKYTRNPDRSIFIMCSNETSFSLGPICENSLYKNRIITLLQFSECWFDVRKIIIIR